MTIVIPRDYHIKQELQKSRVQCIEQDTAQREEIRALRVGILNIMPRAETYEFSLVHPLGRSVLQIEPVWIRLKTHEYRSTNMEHLDHVYIPFEEAIKSQKIDGLIITGAPVEDIPFEEVAYWDEILRILRYARNNIPSTLGICWGGLAIAKFLGIDKSIFEKKLFGVYKTDNLDRKHPITGDMDDVFWCPQSRHSGISDALMEKAAADGVVKLLAHSPDAGYTIMESTDRRFLMHLGHPEYEPERLVHEYNRDHDTGVPGVEKPVNLDLANPVNLWRGHRTEFFSQWIKYIHETISF